MLFTIGGAAALSAVFLWAYWPTLMGIVNTWIKKPDYTHGFLVIPIAFFFLWARRDTIPSQAIMPAWGGLVLLAASIAFRALGAMYYIEAVDGWSIPLWIGGAIWFLCGRHFVLWCAPSVAFLWFMIPMPWTAERVLSGPMQQVAAAASGWTLQCLGQPALAAGNMILLGDHQLDVAEACAGLRMFMGIAAVAFAYLVLVSRPWWQKMLLCAIVVPVAVAANVLRITATGLLCQYVSGEAAQRFSHDAAGWLMILLAVIFFGVFLWWFNRAFTEITPAHQSVSND